MRKLVRNLGICLVIAAVGFGVLGSGAVWASPGEELKKLGDMTLAAEYLRRVAALAQDTARKLGIPLPGQEQLRQIAGEALGLLQLAVSRAAEALAGVR